MPKIEKNPPKESSQMSRREFLKSFTPAVGVAFIGSMAFLNACRITEKTIDQTETAPHETETATIPSIADDQKASAPAVTITSPDAVFQDIMHCLAVDGLVNAPLILSYESVKQFATVTETVTLTCPGDAGETTRKWTGVPVATILAQAGVKPEATQATVSARDYRTILSLQMVKLGGVFLAYKVDGETLSQESGYPLRLVMPDNIGERWVRWVNHIELT